MGLLACFRTRKGECTVELRALAPLECIVVRGLKPRGPSETLGINIAVQSSAPSGPTYTHPPMA
eukprot:3173823-Pyramimonas_sp.AAC.1